MVVNSPLAGDTDNMEDFVQVPVLGPEAALLQSLSPIAAFVHRLSKPTPPALLDAPPPTMSPPKKQMSTASRRTRKPSCKKAAVTGVGAGVNLSLRLARQLITGKKGLAITDAGEKNQEKLMEKYKQAFKDPLLPCQIEALSVLAKSAVAKGRRKLKAA